MTEAPGLSAAARPLLVALAVTALAGGLALALPDDLEGTAVGALFLVATYGFVWRHPGDQVREHGLTLGGLFDDEPIRPAPLLRAALGAVLWSAVLALVFFPPFALGFWQWTRPAHAFALALGPKPLEDVVGQLAAVALPEEAFYRGYLQTELDRALPGRVRVLGAEVGASAVVTSAIFALGHVATNPSAERLAVFFPSLLFGWLRARTGGVGASVAFHASCNLWALALGRGLEVVRG